MKSGIHASDAIGGIMKEKIKRSLAGRLKEVSFGYALLKLLRIPVSLRIATHISDTIV